METDTPTDGHRKETNRDRLRRRDRYRSALPMKFAEFFFFFLRSFAHSVRYSLTIAPTLFFYHADKNPNYDENKCNTVAKYYI